MVNKCSDTARQMTAAEIDCMNHFKVTGIVFFKQWHELAHLDCIGHVKKAEPRHPYPGECDLPHRLTIVDLKIAGHGLFEVTALIAKWPAYS
jgi:hypothetical protein